MTSTARLIFPLIAAMALLAPGTADAQDRSPTDTPIRRSILDSRFGVSAPVTIQSRSSNKAVLIGTVTGAGAAIAFTAAAASRYGENEGGRFCSRCMLQWSAVTLPVGAALGASIGYGVHRARRSVNAMPLVSRRAAGIIVHARF